MSKKFLFVLHCALPRNKLVLKIPCNAAAAALCNRAPHAFRLPNPRTLPLRSLRSRSLGSVRPSSLRLAPPCYGVCFKIQYKNKSRFCFVLPQPQGHIGVSIKEGERARLLFLAREPDSERRYRPEAHGSAQKAFEKKLLTIQACHSERSEESDLRIEAGLLISPFRAFSHKGRGRLLLCLTQTPGGYQSEHKRGRESALLISSERGRQRARYPPKRTAVRKRPLKSTDKKIFVGLRFANPTYELLTIQACHSERSEESASFI